MSDKIIDDLKVDDKIVVWNAQNNKELRHFAFFNDDGRIAVFANGTTSWTNMNHF